MTKIYARGEREPLPDDRTGVIHHFAIRTVDDEGRMVEIDGYIKTGCYADGRLGEVFVQVGKSGDFSAALDAWALGVSWALQVGAELEPLMEKFIHWRFQPAGTTANAKIPMASSPIDYVARWILAKYGNQERLTTPTPALPPAAAA